MHSEAFSYIAEMAEGWDRPELRVLEIGSRNVNGTARDIFPASNAAGNYVGLDINPGPGADVVADGATWDGGDCEKFDVVICMEVFEHAKDWRLICVNAHALLKETGGHFLGTAAGEGRLPHSAVDGNNLLVWVDSEKEMQFADGYTLDNIPGEVRIEFYENIGEYELDKALDLVGGSRLTGKRLFDVSSITRYPRHGDIYWMAERF